MIIDLTGAVASKVQQIYTQLESKASAASNELRNASNEVLSGERHGRYYSYRGIKYRASAPGEPPAVRSGALRSSWRTVENGINPAIASNVSYAETVNGTRPYVDLIKAKAMPKIKEIYKGL